MEASTSRLTSASERAEQGDGWQTMMLGRFAMVSRDAKTHKARKVPRLIVESEDERVLWDIGEGGCLFSRALSLLASRREVANWV